MVNQPIISLSVTKSIFSLIAWLRLLKFMDSWVRKYSFTFDQKFLMGLKLGEWGETNTTYTPIESISSLTFIALWSGKPINYQQPHKPLAQVMESSIFLFYKWRKLFYSSIHYSMVKLLKTKCSGRSIKIIFFSRSRLLGHFP